MASRPGTVTKIYQLKTLGYADLSKELDNVAKKFDAIKKSKLSAQGKLSLTQDGQEVKKYSEEIQKLILQEQELRVENQKLTNEMKAAQVQRQSEIQSQRNKVNANNAEIGSIFKIRQEIKELNALTIVKNKASGSSIDFRGQKITYDEAIARLKSIDCR